MFNHVFYCVPCLTCKSLTVKSVLQIVIWFSKCIRRTTSMKKVCALTWGRQGCDLSRSFRTALSFYFGNKMLLDSMMYSVRWVRLVCCKWYSSIKGCIFPRRPGQETSNTFSYQTKRWQHFLINGEQKMKKGQRRSRGQRKNSGTPKIVK